MLDQLKVRGETAANQLRTLVERAAGEEREFTDAEKATAEELQRSITLSEDQAKTLAELDRSIGALGQLTGPTGNPTKSRRPAAVHLGHAGRLHARHHPRVPG
jgi:phage I-like protein